jgi:Arc/MetJ-type ribon-helix-helix transcriptional regulator
MAKKSIAVTQKKRGRPATGHDPVLTVRLPPAITSAIESWAKQQDDKPSRSEAIRRLIEFALGSRLKKHTSGNK